jgi:hypothetical protein
LVLQVSDAQSPFREGIAYLHLCILAIWGPLVAGIIIAAVSFVTLLLWPAKHGVTTNPWALIALCGLAVIIVIPGASHAELVYVSGLAMRMLAVFLVSSLISLVFGVSDVLLLGRVLHLPKRLSVLTVALVRFVPAAQRSIEAVMLSQRSRGFVLHWWGLLSLTTYRVIMVPFLVGILRSALGMWVSLNMRQWAVYEPRCRSVGLLELAFLCVTLCMWRLPG